MQFKDRIRELRNERKMSVSDMAKTFGKSESAIRMWEAGKNKPDADTLIELARFIGCSTDYLLGLTDVQTSDIDTQAICDKLGISETAIDQLRYLQNWSVTVKRAKANSEPLTVKQAPITREFMHFWHTRVRTIHEEQDALNLFLENCVSSGFFRFLWDYLYVQYFSEGDNNPTHEGDNIMKNFLKLPDEEPERIKGSVLLVDADTPNGEGKRRVSIKSLNETSRFEMMEILSDLKKQVAAREASANANNPKTQ